MGGQKRTRPAVKGASRRKPGPACPFYDFDRARHGRLTAGQIPADIVYGARKMEVG
jgi:hypothetical protein